MYYEILPSRQRMYVLRDSTFKAKSMYVLVDSTVYIQGIENVLHKRPKNYASEK
jgi:hypothetical protein